MQKSTIDLLTEYLSVPLRTCKISYRLQNINNYDKDISTFGKHHILWALHLLFYSLNLLLGPAQNGEQCFCQGAFCPCPRPLIESPIPTSASNKVIYLFKVTFILPVSLSNCPNIKGD